MNESMYEHFARMYGPDRVRWDDAGRLYVDVPGEGDMTFTFPRPRVVPAEETYLMVRRQFGFPLHAAPAPSAWKRVIEFLGACIRPRGEARHAS